MAEKDGEDVDDHEDDAEDAAPDSIVRQCPRRGPPSAAELRDFKSKPHAVDDAYTRLVAFEIGAHHIGRASRRHLHQDVLTRFWALVKQYGVPFNLGQKESVMAKYSVKGDPSRLALDEHRRKALAAAPAKRAELDRDCAQYAAMLRGQTKRPSSADPCGAVPGRSVPRAVLLRRLREQLLDRGGLDGSGDPAVELVRLPTTSAALDGVPDENGAPGRSYSARPGRRSVCVWHPVTLP
jgi:hypothetical protein